MFKNIKFLVIIFIISILALTGCEVNSSTTYKSNSSNTTPLSDTEFAQLYTKTNKLEGRRVNFFARIFTEPVKDDKGAYFEAYANDDHSKIIKIGISDTQLVVKNGDIIEVYGVVGKLDGEKYFSKSDTAPSIEASEIEKFAYTPAFTPAIKTIQVNKEISQNGYIVNLNKIEVAKKETRLFINIDNTTKDKIRFKSLNAKVMQGDKELKKLSNVDEEIPEIDSDILPGVNQKGILIYEPIQVDGDNLKIIFEGESDNHNLHFTPFTFDVTLK